MKKFLKTHIIFFGSILIGVAAVIAMAFFETIILGIMAGTVPVVFALALWCVHYTEVLPDDMPESFDILNDGEGE